MLDAMRRGAVNWLAKVLLGLLIVAFALWGVADVFRNYGRGTLARIGNTEISVDEYRQAYQEEMASISRRLGGRRLTAEQAKMLGVEQRTLSRLIGTAAIDTHARELHLALSDQAIADIIRTDPAFQDATGKFSSDTFRSLLRQNGISEARYIASRRKDEVREQLTDTLLGGVSPPQLLIDLLHRYRDETRVIEFFTPDYDKLIKIAEPDEAKLKEYYDQNKRQFMTPELRKVNVLLLTRADVKARLPVSEEEMKAAYEQDKEKFNIPEKRRVLQLAFPDKAAAEKAYAELAKRRQLRRSRRQAGVQGERHRPRPARPQGHDRRQDRRRGLRPEEGRAVEAGRGAVLDRAGARQRHRAGQAAHLRRGQERDQGPARGRARQPGDPDAAREGRERALRGQVAQGDRREPEAALPRDRGDGSRRQDRRRQAGDRASPRPPRSRRPRSPAPPASRRRPPTSATAAMSGSMCSASRRRSRSPSRR